MVTFGLIFLVSITTMLLFLLLWVIEYQRGTRIVAHRIRLFLDRVLFSGEVRLQRFSFWYRHLVVRLGFRSLVHSVLRALLLTLSYVYDRLLWLFERNLTAAKALRKERKRWRTERDT